MIRVAAIVEGYGDVKAVPVLVARTGQLLGVQMFAAEPIRAGEWRSLRAVGELERYLELAHRRGWEHILVLLDLDDDCAMVESTAAAQRVAAWVNGRNLTVSLVFFVREYESIFLACTDDLTNGTVPPTEDPESYRDAKGSLKRLIGRRYKETQDQEAFTRLITLNKLATRSRSYRKLLKELSGMTYDEISNSFGNGV